MAACLESWRLEHEFKLQNSQAQALEQSDVAKIEATSCQNILILARNWAVPLKLAAAGLIE